MQCCEFFIMADVSDKEANLKNIADLKVCNFIKKRLQHRCFPVNIAEFLKNLF